MILSRVTKALRRQNWLAVCLEFVIVFLGVVIGFQFSINSGYRADLREEQRIIDQLRVEIAEALEMTEQFLTGRQHRLDMLTETAVIIQSDEAQELTDWQCWALRDSHVPFFDNITVQTVDELVNSGMTRVLRDSELRDNVFEYARSHAANRELILITQQMMVSLPDNFPDTIRYEADAAEYGAGLPVCDVLAMNASAAFQNTLFGNIQRATTLRDFTGRELDALNEIQTWLNSHTEPDATSE